MNGFTSQLDVLPGAGLPVDAMPMAAAFPDDDWFYEAVTIGGVSESGISVTPKSALSHGPVWQAVNLLMGDVGILPFHKMRKEGRNREKDRNHPLWFLLTQQPNSMQTPAIWKETMMAWSLLWGNAICYIDRGSGMLGTKAEQLIPLLPDRTGYIKENGKYLITTWIEDRYYVFHDWETFHIRGLATNGFWGEGAVQVARNVVGHGLALRRHGNTTFKNGSVPRGILKHPGKIGPEQREHYRDEWNQLYGGIDNQGKVALLQQGAEFQVLSFSNVDAQWLEATRLDREQVAALFNLPNHKLNALENAAVRANLEEQNLQYLMMALARHLNKFKEEAERKLLTEKERRSGEHYFKWVVEAFLRGNSKDRNEGYMKGRAGGWLSVNDVRELEDMNPIEGGDDYSNPAINPVDKTEDGEATVDDGQEEENIGKANRLLTQMVKAMLSAESNKVRRAVAGGKNFVEWLDGFYGAYSEFAAEYLEIPMQAVAGLLKRQGDWQSVIAAHATAQHEALLTLAGWHSQEELEKIVKEPPLTTTAGSLVNRIMESISNG